MKYIVKESQIKKLVFKFLDQEYENLNYTAFNDGEFTISDNHLGDVIRLVLNDIGHLASEETYVLNPDFIKKIDEMFNLSPGDSIEFVIDWLNDKFDLDVENYDYYNFGYDE